MRQKTKTRHKPRLLREALLYRSMAGSRFALKVYGFKRDSTPDEVFEHFPALFSREEDLQRIHGSLFPVSARELFDEPALVRPVHITNEIAWAAALCKRYARRLSRYVQNRDALQRELLLGNETKVHELLRGIESEFGTSVWLIQVQLAVSQLWGTSEERRKRASELDSIAQPQSITKMLLRFLHRRGELLRTKDKLQEELEPILEANTNYALQLFLKDKILNPLNPMPLAITSGLLFEAQSSLIDLYEALIRYSQIIATDSNIPKRASLPIGRFLTALYGVVQDKRLVPVVAAITGRISLDNVDLERARLVELYFASRHEEFLSASMNYVKDSPDDIFVLCMTVKAAAFQGITLKQVPGLIGDLANDLLNLFKLTDEVYGSALSIFSMAEQFAPFDWARYIHVIAVHELREEDLEFPTYNLKRMVTLDSRVTPYIRLLWSQQLDAAHAATLKELANAYPIASAALDLALLGQEPAFEIDDYRYVISKAQYLYASGRHSDALQIIEKGVADAKLGRAGRLMAIQCALLVEMRRWNDAARVAVCGHFETKVVAEIFPIGPVVKGLGNPALWGKSIDIPLLFQIYSTFFGSDKWPHFRLSFENFLQCQGTERPEDFGASASDFGLERAVAFMDSVWIPEVMRQTVLYTSAEAIDAARVEVCRVLSELDPKNREKYAEEIRDRIKTREISRTAKLVEQSKVYVDVAAIKRSLRKRLSGSYSRYKIATQGATTDSNIDRLFDVISQMDALRDRSVTQLLSGLLVGDLPRGEADAQFDSLFGEILNEFLFGDHGLNAYLSTRVRHGKLTRALRKSVESESLVTSRREGATSYLPNDFWKNKLHSDFPGDADLFLQALERFSASFDAILEDVNKRLIRISVVGAGARQHTEDSLGAFSYWSTQLERKFIQNADRESATVDELVDRCVEVLWEKTDQSLAKLRAILETTVRRQLNGCFESLQTAINELGYAGSLDGFNNGIARARTETNAKLSEVVRWFKRSEVYDRQDYPLDFAVHIARSILEKTLSGSDRWADMEVKSDLQDGCMPGRTLDGMVDLFDNLLVNAAKHSGLSLARVDISIDMHRANRRYVLLISNSAAASAWGDAQLLKLEEIREAIRLRDTKRLAQGDTGSGLYKVWRALNSPALEDPLLNFGFADGRFNVEIEFTLEEGDEAVAC